MPIWDAPPRRLVTLIQRLARDRREHAPAQDDVSRERVQAVLPGDAAVVRDRVVPVSGQARLRAGEEVHVWNRAGQPVLILAHAARRAQFPQVPQPVGQVVEELFLAGDRSTGVFDVYFRNFDQVTKLGLSAHVSATGPPGSVPTSLLAWGAGTDRFLLQSGSIIRVFRLNRKPNVSYQPGQKAKATLESTLDLTAIVGNAFTGLTATVEHWSWVEDPPNPPVFTLGLSGTYTFNLPFAVPGSQLVPDNEGGGTNLLVTRSALKIMLDERGHVIVTYRVAFFPSIVAPVHDAVRSMACDVTVPAALFGPHQDITNTPPVPMLDFSNSVPVIIGGSNFTQFISPKNYRIEVASMKDGALVQSTIRQEETGGQTFPTNPFHTAVTFITVGAPSVSLLDEYPGARQVFLQVSRRHILWAVSPLSNPFTSPAQVFLQAVAVPDIKPPLVAGDAVQVGTTLREFFFPASVDTYGNALVLLRPFDVLWATVLVDESTQAIVSERLFPVAAWKTSDPSIITLQEAETKFPPKDTPLVPIVSLKKLPVGVVIFGGTVTPAVQVFQAINDAELLASVGRKKTS